MKKISSKQTFYFKKVFPIIWFGTLGFVVFLNVASKNSHFISYLGPIMMATIGFTVMKAFIWSLADEVLDQGDSLKVTKGNTTVVIPFTQIMNVSYMNLANPPKITLQLREETKLGKEISFSAPLSLNPFKKHPLINDLIIRVDKAK